MMCWGDGTFRKASKNKPWLTAYGLIARCAFPARAHRQSRDGQQLSPPWHKENGRAALEGVGWKLKVRPFLREMHQCDRAHGRGVGTRWSLRSLPTLTVLWFYDSVLSVMWDFYEGHPSAQGGWVPSSPASCKWKAPSEGLGGQSSQCVRTCFPHLCFIRTIKKGRKLGRGIPGRRAPQPARPAVHPEVQRFILPLFFTKQQLTQVVGWKQDEKWHRNYIEMPGFFNSLLYQYLQAVWFPSCMTASRQWLGHTQQCSSNFSTHYQITYEFCSCLLILSPSCTAAARIDAGTCAGVVGVKADVTLHG